MIQYLDLLRHVLEHGKFKADRTGTGTFSVFGAQIRCPLLTTKKVHTKSIFYELLWFLRGDTNVKWLNEHGVTIWDEWADKDGNLDRVYGAQWTDWRTADGRSLNQIDDVIAQIKRNPDSRRHIVPAWNPGEIQPMALPSCHTLFQFYVSEGELSCQLYQCSADIFLGVTYFCHIADCYYAVLINADEGFMLLGLMMALSSSNRGILPPIRNGGGGRQFPNRNVFCRVSPFCYN